jgi:predicted lipoprotein
MTSYVLRFSVLACALLLSSPLAAKQVGYFALVQRTVDTYIVPHFKQFQITTSKFKTAVKDYCAAPDKAGLERVTQTFGDVVDRWAEVNFVRLGPLSQKGRAERIAFWPDPRGVMQRQLRSFLAKRVPTVLDPAALAKQSAAAQGLFAFEYLLTDTETPIGAPSEDGKYRCAFASAIAENIDNIARDVLDEWQAEDGWRMRMLTPGSDNPLYPEPSSAAAELVKSLLTGLEVIQDQQLGPRPPRGGAAPPPEPAKPFRGPFYRSGLSPEYMRAGLHGLATFYDVLKLQDYVPAEKAWIKKWIAQAFHNLDRDSTALLVLSGPHGETGERQKRMKPIRFHINGIRRLIGLEVASAAGLILGFNELDGD